MTPDQPAVAALVERQASLANVVKASEEDLQWLYPGRSVEDSLAAWAALGPRFCVATLGERGALAILDGERIEVPAPRIDVVDTVGAGDSFMSALLSAMDHDSALGAGARAARAARRSSGWLRFAAAASAITCTRKGSDPPTRAEVEAALEGLKRRRHWTLSERSERCGRRVTGLQRWANEGRTERMATTDAAAGKRRPRPLSPHLGIYKLTMTMAMSIAHRITGAGLYVGVLLLAWFLIAASTDAASFGAFSAFIESIIGRLVLFGFTWALVSPPDRRNSAFPVGRRLRHGRAHARSACLGDADRRFRADDRRMGDRLRGEIREPRHGQRLRRLAYAPRAGPLSRRRAQRHGRSAAHARDLAGADSADALFRLARCSICCTWTTTA